ncbi:MAG: SusC/RagA family TonB-linked outer membrane protein [Paludibacteraceae bacterium]|nr:SusC/RagA family TonB-linked outer membrane protein [Paludibacteraceae bacterium]
MNHKFLIVPLLWLSVLVSAQTRTFRGVVTDTSGESLIGASVLVQGTTTGTITDFDGNFEITCAEGALLEFSYIGYRTQTLPAAADMTVRLAEDNEQLEEVVVIGYGSLSKKEVSSSIVQVDSKNFVKGPMNNPMEMLNGKVAGLTVNSTSAADPNASSSLQIRGAGSLSGSNEPLYVIDGIAGGDIRNLSSQDIESITVLKDAASAAIYGTRGANGVVLITTKKGSAEQGHFSVTYDSYFGANVAKPHMEVLSAEEFRRSRRGTDYGYNTDWYSEITRPAAYDINQYINVATSTKGGSYTASLNYKDANGLDIVSARREYGGRFAMEQRMLKDYLTLSASLTGRRVDETWGDNGQVDNAMSMNPTMPVYNADGSYYQPTGTTGATNPVTRLKETASNGQRLYMMANVGLKLKLYTDEHHNLNTSVAYSLDYNDLKSNTYASSKSNESFWGGYKGRANVNYAKNNTHHLDWLLNYDFQMEQHTLRFVFGTSWEQHNWEQVGAENRDFTFDNTLWHNIGAGTWLADGTASMWTGRSQSSLFGFFGRVNYNWRDMLFVSASIRREASTKFGVKSRWGNFPSASIAWEMTEAEFMEPAKPVLKSLKPRFSYGVTGREPGDSYQSLATYSTRHQYFMDGEWVVGYASDKNANPILSWEKSESYNIGVDFDLWHRLRGSIEYYIRRSPDLLYNYTAPQPPFVHPSILVNVGTTTNRGVEVSLNGDIFTGKDFHWNMGINYAYGRTYLTKLSNDVYQATYLELYQKPGVGTSEYFFRVEEGGEIGQFYGYEFAGIDANGNMLVLDNNGNAQPVGSADASWKRYIGNGAPKHTLSWTNSFEFHNFDLSVLFTGAFDYSIFNMRKYGMGLSGSGSDNVLRTAYTTDKYVKTGGGVITSYFLEDGSYFKLDNITLGYNWRWQDKLVDGLRLYVTAKNIYTLTRYSGNDPSIVAVTGITPGVDTSSAYPTATQLCLGVTLNLH